ncbi:HAD family phosphatase, partial [Bifidobacterium amazonense]|nr:HAD family phosphatase [Bifidobacterium amazonense]
SAAASGATLIAQTGYINTDTSNGPQFASISSYAGVTADVLDGYVRQRVGE